MSLKPEGNLISALCSHHLPLCIGLAILLGLLGQNSGYAQGSESDLRYVGRIGDSIVTLSVDAESPDASYLYAQFAIVGKFEDDVVTAKSLPMSRIEYTIHGSNKKPIAKLAVSGSKTDTLQGSLTLTKGSSFKVILIRDTLSIETRLARYASRLQRLFQEDDPKSLLQFFGLPLSFQFKGKRLKIADEKTFLNQYKKVFPPNLRKRIVSDATVGQHLGNYSIGSGGEVWITAFSRLGFEEIELIAVNPLE